MIKDLWRRGEAAHGLWCSTPDVPVLELAGRAGFDYVTLDLQHGLTTWATVAAGLRALRSLTTTLVRVPRCTPDAVMRALDFGAHGVIVPLVEDRETAEQAVSACRYPTARPGALGGTRSYGPSWADHDGVVPTDEANDAVVCVVQVETARALDRLDEIVSTPGVDAVYVGPYDLALSCGWGDATYRDSDLVVEACQRVVDATAAAGIAAGMHCDGPEMVAFWQARGVRMLTAGMDFGVIREAFGALARTVATSGD